VSFSTIVAITPDGQFVYVTNQFDSTVSVIETSSNTVTDTVIVGDTPTYVAITPDGQFAYVTNMNDNTISVINTASNTVTDTVIVGSEPVGIAFTPNGQFAYVANFNDNTISVINTVSNTVTDTVDIGNNPTGVAITPDGQFVYVTNQVDNTVSVIETSSNSVTDTVTVGSLPTLVAITPSPTGIEYADGEALTVFTLEQNYPNPFNPFTTIKFSLSQRSYVTLTVYDVAGREVARLVDEVLFPGQYQITFDGMALNSGVYFYRLHSGKIMETRKFVLVR
jgi:YVTN family beta-propeller protein